MQFDVKIGLVVAAAVAAVNVVVVDVVVALVAAEFVTVLFELCQAK